MTTLLDFIINMKSYMELSKARNYQSDRTIYNRYENINNQFVVDLNKQFYS